MSSSISVSAKGISRRSLLLAGLGGTAAVLLHSRRRAAEAMQRAPSGTIVAHTSRLEVPDHRIAVRSEFIEPKMTDAAIDRGFEPHYVVFPSGPRRNQMFLFFHATGTFPEDYQILAEQAARNGFHAINLRYASLGWEVAAVATQCRTDPDPMCSENIRLEQFDGTDRSSRISQNYANSIVGRLAALLRHLQARYPDEGWGGYLRDGAPRWNAIAVAGHSQGGVHAPLIAQKYPVVRVAMLSAPGEGVAMRSTTPVTPPSWLLGPHATPSDRYFAFAHLKDENYDLPLQWSQLRLGMSEFGSVANVDESGPPFGGSHLLITNQTPGVPRKPAQLYHATTARDDVTPKALDGQPLFAPIWQYMCFA